MRLWHTCTAKTTPKPGGESRPSLPRHSVIATAGGPLRGERVFCFVVSFFRDHISRSDRLLLGIIIVAGLGSQIRVVRGLISLSFLKFVSRR
jgi:hypothetical protein